MRRKKLERLNISLPVAIKKEGAMYVAYTPALDLSTYGKTKGEAKKNFSEIVSVFFDEFTDNPDGLEVVLFSLGWVKQRQTWQPPKIVNITQDVNVAIPA